MNATTIKYLSATAIAIMVIASVPFIGFTVDAADSKQGVMLDFAYYNVEWVPFEFTDGMTGLDALERTCSEKGYGVEFDDDGSVYSVNNVPRLMNVDWGMYVLTDKDGTATWTEVADPSSYIITDERIISWARTGTGSEMMPATDSTGFTYYSYATSGTNRSGEQLKVATLAPSVTETVCAIGGYEYITATDRYSDYPNKLLKARQDGEIKEVGGYTDPNFELIVADRPDIVFLDGGTSEHVTMADKLRKAGVNCVVLYEAVDTDSLLKNLWICASALGFPENGNAYIKDVKEAINNICRIPDLTGKTVFVSLGVSDSPYTAGAGTYVTSMIESLGAVNIFSDSSSWFMVDKEAVYDRQPDVIIIIYDVEEIKTQRQYRSLLNDLNDVWKRTPAFQNGNVYVFSGDAASLISRPGARLPEALELMAKILDPDAFVAADPTDTIGVKYYNNGYNDGDNGYLTYVKAKGLLEWQKD